MHGLGKAGCWLVLAVLFALLLAPLGSGRPSSLRAEALRDAAHLPLFTLVLILLHAGLAASGRGRTTVPGGSPAGWPRLGGISRLAPAVLLAILLGGLSELLQALGPRTPSWQDFGYNLLGILAGTAILLVKNPPGHPRRSGRTLGVAAICLAGLALTAWPWLRIEHALRLQARAFPQLGDFEKPWEFLVWIPQGAEAGSATRIAASTAAATRGSHSLRVDASGAPWSGVRLVIEIPLRWEPGQALGFDVINPGERFELGIRVDAAGGRRFTGAATILPGTHPYRIPPEALADGKVRLANTGGIALETLVFHLGENPQPRSFHLDDVRLD